MSLRRSRQGELSKREGQLQHWRDFLTDLHAAVPMAVRRLFQVVQPWLQVHSSYRRQTLERDLTGPVAALR